MLQTTEPGALWQRHPATYRASEVQTLLNWIAVGASGSLLGLPGAGRSHLLGFLCHRPDVVATHWGTQRLPLVLLLVDLDDLPTNTLNDLYRVILRTFYEGRALFSAPLQATITRLYLDQRSTRDPFLTQSALRELFFEMQNARQRVVLVMDRFDSLCRQLTPIMAQALGALRNHFRDTLSYIVGIRQSLTYLEELEISNELYRLFTTHVCYLGALAELDARNLIARRTSVQETQPSEHEIQAMLTLTGGYPTLLKAVCRWWLLAPDPPAPEHWLPLLLAMPTIQQRLQNLWAALTQEEQMTLTELVKERIGERQPATVLQQQYVSVLQTLQTKGLCRQQSGKWSVAGLLFRHYITQVGEMSRGRIWLDQSTHILYHGTQALTNLTPKETEILQFLVKQPSVRHTYTEVIFHAWTKEESYNGVSTDSLFQVVHGLRHKIEPNPLQPVYVVNWRGKPEGGYIFYPEGRPA